jgi:MFS transporter, DHA3 family, macrolide efflux protein
MATSTRPFRGFVRIWLGQIVSLLGSAMTRFALTIYVWQLTGEATPVVLIGVFAALPAALISLWAGVLVDRWDRKRTLLLADIGSASATGLLLLFLLIGEAQLWQIYLVAAVSGVCNTFQWLAFSSTLSSLVEKEQLGRANGMMSLAEYVALVGAPLLAGVLIPSVDIQGILMLDILSFLVAVVTIASARIPTRRDENSEASEPSEKLLEQITFGFRYIFSRAPLRALLIVFILFIAVEAIGYTLLAPMILARSGGSESTLGAVQAVMGVGGIVGGLLISVWGGPKRRIYGVLLGLGLTGVFGDALMGVGQGLLVWMIAGFALEVSIPLLISSHRGIWQAKVPPAMQGRIFATLGFLVGFAEPTASIVAGTLADRVLEPAMRSTGWLAQTFAPLVGTGAGAGMALLFVVSGAALGIIALAGFAIPTLRKLEVLIPDYVENDEISATKP